MFSQLFAAAVLALSAQSAFAATCTRSYTVKAGDYCDKVSAAQGVSTFQLAAVNSGKINGGCTNLQIGESYCLGYEKEDCTSTYVVKSEDTCSGIQTAHNVNSTILRLNNPQIDENCHNLYIGEVLCVAQTVQVPAIPSTGVVVPVSGPPAHPPSVPDNKPAPTAITVTPPAAPTPAPAAPAPAPAQDDDDCDDDDAAADDDDDSDLPYCDEIEDGDY